MLKEERTIMHTKTFDSRFFSFISYLNQKEISPIQDCCKNKAQKSPRSLERLLLRLKIFSRFKIFLRLEILVRLKIFLRPKILLRLKILLILKIFLRLRILLSLKCMSRLFKYYDMIWYDSTNMFKLVHDIMIQFDTILKHV